MQTRSKYIKQLENLEGYLTRLSEKTVADIRAAGSALAGNAEAADAVLQGRNVEDRLRTEIERECLDIMLLQQPLVAGDLRFVSGAFRAVSDIAHIDSKTRDVAYLAQNMPAEATAGLQENFAALAERTANMVETAYRAFSEADEEAAREVFAMDDAVDDLYHKTAASVVELIRASKESSEIDYLPELLMVAKYFERMGDDAQRVADWALFRVTGEHDVYSAQRKGADNAGE